MASMAFRLGRLLLAFLLVAFAANHLVGFFTFAQSDTERIMFLGLAALDLLGLTVVLAAYRHGERWAWAAVWLPIVTTAAIVPYVNDRSIGTFYLGAALVMAAAQAATWPRTGAGRPRATVRP